VVEWVVAVWAVVVWVAAAEAWAAVCKLLQFAVPASVTGCMLRKQHRYAVKPA